jgi:hypothetical protein
MAKSQDELFDPARGVFTTQRPIFLQFAHRATLLAGRQVLLVPGIDAGIRFCERPFPVSRGIDRAAPVSRSDAFV